MKSKVLKIASLGEVTAKGNVTAYTASGARIFVPERLAAGIAIGEFMVVIDQEITQTAMTDEAGNPMVDDNNQPRYMQLDVPQIRSTATFIGSREECLEAASEELMSDELVKEYVVLSKEEQLASLRVKFQKPAANAPKGEEAVVR